MTTPTGDLLRGFDTENLADLGEPARLFLHLGSKLRRGAWGHHLTGRSQPLHDYRVGRHGSNIGGDLLPHVVRYRARAEQTNETVEGEPRIFELVDSGHFRVAGSAFLVGDGEQLHPAR